MSDSLSNTFIAIDGGGTHCRLALSDGVKQVTVEAGSANVTTDFEGALHQIMSGLSRLTECAKLPIERLESIPAFVGLAGVSGPATARRLNDALPFRHMRIEDDRPAALRGALGLDDGAIAHCGTGSFFAAQFNGVQRYAGGWGPVLGDEASAQSIGKAALRLTLESVDGRRCSTALSEKLLAKFQGSEGVVQFAGTASPSDLGALAPLVTKQASDADAIAEAIMRDAAGDIACILPQLGWCEGKSICLTGGLGRHYSPYMPAMMQRDIITPVGEPIAGALALAAELAQEVAA